MKNRRRRWGRQRVAAVIQSVPVTEISKFPSDAIHHPDDVLPIAIYHPDDMLSIAVYDEVHYASFTTALSF